MKKKLTWASFIFGKLGEPIKAHFMSNRWTYQAGSNKWKQDQQHGKGIYIWADGTAWFGSSKNGKRHGKCRYYADGKVYECEYKNGKLLNTDGSISDSDPFTEDNLIFSTVEGKWVPVYR